MTFPSLSRVLGIFVGTVAIVSVVGCAGGSGGKTKYPVYPPSDVSGPVAQCEKLCDLEVYGETIDEFCADLVKKANDRVGAATCKPQSPLGLPTRDEAAVRDAMVVDLFVPSPNEMRISTLALRTERGWELATELGKLEGAAIESPDSLKVVGARAVDADGLAPYGVEVRVRIDAQGELVDKVFVCGRKGKSVTCPKAVVAST